MTQHPQTSTDPKIEAVQRLYAAVGTNDIDAILAELADDVDWAAEAAGTAVPWWGHYHGTGEVPQFFKELGTNIEITEFTPTTYTSNETDVMVVVRFGYTVNATGKHAAMDMQHLWRFADGKIVYFRGAEDTEQSAAAFSTRAEPTGPDPKIAVIQSVYEAFGRGDLDAILANVADDVDWSAEAAGESVPWYGRYSTKAELPGFFQQMGSSIDVTEFTPLSFTSNETDVMVTIHWGFTAKATGKSVAQNLHHWWRFADGKIVFYRGSDDSELTAAAFS